MKNFKRIMLPLQGHSKNDLHWLYNTKDDEEPEKIFDYENLQFWFNGTGHRNSERLLFYITVSSALFLDNLIEDALPYENYMLHFFSPIIESINEEYLNTEKNIREKAQFLIQSANQNMLRRSGISYDYEKKCFILCLIFCVPLVNAVSVNAKAAVSAVKNLLKQIVIELQNIDKTQLLEYAAVYRRQQEIRRFMKEQNICAFIGNGSILPREGEKPKEGAVLFESPAELEVTISLSDGTQMRGMGIRSGITVIIGGGYSGKSTLLNAVEMGIYNHIPGDGREYVLTEESALQVYTEDKRPVSNINISPFFHFIPEKSNLEDFSTPCASGSVSQAANIIEAVCGGSKLLLLDEDKSAANFMLRDCNMRRIIKKEPIIPFTDRIRELHQKKGVSTIFVIGASSEYLSYADTVILMNHYHASDITKDISSMGLTYQRFREREAEWQNSRRLSPTKTTQPFLYFRSVETKNEKKIILDNYSADITSLTALCSNAQLNMLAKITEKLLTDKEADSNELLEKIKEHIKDMLSCKKISSLTTQYFYEEVRPLDAFCCINRILGLQFF